MRAGKAVSQRAGLARRVSLIVAGTNSAISEPWKHPQPLNSFCQSFLRQIDPLFALECRVRSIFRQEWEQAAPSCRVQRGAVLGNFESLHVLDLPAALGAVSLDHQVAVAVGQRPDATAHALGQPGAAGTVILRDLVQI